MVFDTNVFVSALVFPGGLADRALREALSREDTVLLSRPILDELLGVLARKFSRDSEELARVAVFLDDLTETIEPSERIDALADEPDNRVLECAVEGRADCAVSGDQEVLALGAFRGIRMLSVRAFVELDRP